MEVSSRVWAPLLGQGGSYVVLGTILCQLERLDASGSPGLWQRVPPQLCCAALIYLVVRIEGGESEDTPPVHGRHWSSQASVVERLALEHLGLVRSCVELKTVVCSMLNAPVADTSEDSTV